MDNEFLGERRRALEESYFAKHNRALLERLRAANESSGSDGAATEGAADIDTALLAAVSLAPLVAIAWAKGEVDDNERSIVFARAGELGLNEAHPSHRLLERWLAEPPPPELLATWKRDCIGALSSTLSHEAKRQLRSEILGRARAIAEATGAYSGVGRMPSDAEQAVLEEIEDALS